ncbi:MAG: beta galactosidase jelly roll domain-containing protein, partial [Rhodospirillales bacterium]|nr:beta galactosidase jelly roll domain-containing protein [Rhodospirillales bacterium]
PLPAEYWGVWRFHLDPVDQGLRVKVHAPAFDDSGWPEIRVPAWYSETEIGAYNGVAWYRMHFRVPDAWRGRDLRILFAAVDKEGWVYLNGQLLREHTAESEGRSVNDIYDSPFFADAPAGVVRFGEDNVLTVRVRNAFAGGGISRPVFIHAPR